MDPSTALGEGDCTDAVVDYVRRLHSAAAATHSSIQWVAGEAWVRSSADGVTQRQPVKQPSLAFFSYSFVASYPILHENVRAAVAADKDFGPLIGSMVGDEGGARRFNDDTVVNFALDAIVGPHGELLFDEDVVRGRVHEIRAFVTARERHETAIVPLPGLTSTLFPFVVTEGIEIDNLTPEEVSVCADAGVLRPIFENVPMLQPEECVGARIAVTVATHAFPAGSRPDLAELVARAESSHRFGDRSRFHLSEMMEDLLLVLRLSRSDFIGGNGIVLTSRTLLGSSYTWQTRQTRQFVRTAYIIDEETAARIADLWATLTKLAPFNRPPQIALRRFNAATDRVTLDDAVVDHLIAAEALFLHDVGSPDDRTELSFRLALRMALFLEATGRDRHSTFRFVKAAYKLRSRIAHGGNPPTEVLITKGKTLSLAHFVDELAALMRDGLRLAIDRSRSDSSFGSAEWWDALILGAAE
ncbi:MAG: hypothetical protein ABSG36_18010 [Acidimicrobiales bacterium]|jgi:hypothetical protein